MIYGYQLRVHIVLHFTWQYSFQKSIIKKGFNINDFQTQFSATYFAPNLL